MRRDSQDEATGVERFSQATDNAPRARSPGTDNTPGGTLLAGRHQPPRGAENCATSHDGAADERHPTTALPAQR
ncbi:hypothetical protein KJK32_09170 [Streptomyces sp. JCM17656]|nr:hypothetical protein KJK32_09170 [Streptomyces sp. JCM17656]